MRAYVTRESVCAADDFDPPHGVRLRVPDDWTWEDLVQTVWRGSRLPWRGSEVPNAGGKATWALSSNIPLAVFAQEWNTPVLLSLLDSDRERLDVADREIRFHWSYFPGLDPTLVLQVLKELRLRAVTA